MNEKEGDIVVMSSRHVSAHDYEFEYDSTGEISSSSELEESDLEEEELEEEELEESDLEEEEIKEESDGDKVDVFNSIFEALGIQSYGGELGRDYKNKGMGFPKLERKKKEEEEDLIEEKVTKPETSKSTFPISGVSHKFGYFDEGLVYPRKEGKTKASFIDTLEIVSIDGCSLEFADDEYRNNRTIVLTAVEENGNALNYASEELKNDYHIVSTAVSRNGEALGHAGTKMRSNKKIVLRAVRNNGEALIFASEDLKDDEDVVMAAVRNEGESLRYASHALRGNKDVVLEAVTNDGYALDYASFRLKRVKEVVIRAVLSQGYALEFAGDELKEDKDVLFLAVHHSDGDVLEFARGDYFQDDRFFFLSCVSRDEHVVEYANEMMRSDPGFIIEAVRSNPYFLRFVNKRLLYTEAFLIDLIRTNTMKEHEHLEVIFEYIPEHLINSMKFVQKLLDLDDRLSIHITQFSTKAEVIRKTYPFVYEAVSKNGMLLEEVGDEMKNDEEIVLAAARNNHKSFNFASEYLRNSAEFIIRLMKMQDEESGSGSVIMISPWKFFEMAGEWVKSDPDSVLQIVSVYEMALLYADDELKRDEDFILRGLEFNSSFMRFASYRLKDNLEFVKRAVTKEHFSCSSLTNLRDLEICKLALARDGFALGYVHDEIQDSKECVMIALAQDPSVLHFASKRLRNDEEVAEFALSKDSKLFRYIGRSLKSDRSFVLRIIKDINWKIFHELNYEMRIDTDIVLEVLRKDYTQITKLEESIKHDPEFIIEAIRANKQCLIAIHESADTRFKQLLNDKHWIRNAIRYEEEVFKYMSWELRMFDESFCVEVVCVNPKAVQFIEEEDKEDEELFIRLVVDRKPETIRDFMEIFDFQFVQRLIKLYFIHDHRVLVNLPEKLRNDPEFMRTLVLENSETSIHCIGEKLRKSDIPFIKWVIQQNPEFLKLVDNSLRNDREFLLDAMSLNVEEEEDEGETDDDEEKNLELLIKYCGEEVKNDKVFVMDRILPSNGLLLEFVGEDLKDDDDVVKTAISQNGKSFEFASGRLKKDEEFALSICILHPEIIEFIDPSICSEKSFIRRIISNYGVEKGMEMFSKNLGIGRTHESVVLGGIDFLTRKIGEVDGENQNRNMELSRIYQKRAQLYIHEETKGICLDYRKSLIDYLLGYNLFPREELEEEIKNKLFIPDKKQMFRSILTSSPKEGILEHEKLRDLMDVYIKDKWIRDLSSYFGTEKNEKALMEYQEKTFFEVFDQVILYNFFEVLGIGEKSTIRSETVDMFRPFLVEECRRILVTLKLPQNNNEKAYLLFIPLGLGMEFQAHTAFLRNTVFRMTYFGEFESGSVSSISGDPIRHGKGQEFEKGVVVFEGLFRLGKRDGRGEYHNTKTGDVIRATWDEGELLKNTVFKFSCPLVAFNSIEKYLQVDKIKGSGAFGIVYELKTQKLNSLLPSVNHIRDKTVAVKIMRVTSDFQRDILFRMTKRGIGLCSTFRSKHVLEIYGIIRGKRAIGYIMGLGKLSMDKMIENLNSKGVSMKMEEKIRILNETQKGMVSLFAL